MSNQTSKCLCVGSVLFILLITVPPAFSQDFLSADQQGSTSADKLFERTVVAGDSNAEGKWSGKANAGLVVSTGNAKNSNLNLGLNVNYDKQRWRHAIAASTYFAENNGAQTAERYALSHKVDYSTSANGFVFNFLSYDSDEFATIDSRIADVVGYGRNLISTDKHNLEAEVGVGYRQTKFTGNVPDSEEAVGHLGLNYSGKLTPTTTLTENVLVQGGSDNVFTESITGLNLKMTEKLSLGLSYTIRNNSDAPAGIEKTDTVTSINLIAGF